MGSNQYILNACRSLIECNRFAVFAGDSDKNNKDDDHQELELVSEGISLAVAKDALNKELISSIDDSKTPVDTVIGRLTVHRIAKNLAGQGVGIMCFIIPQSPNSYRDLAECLAWLAMTSYNEKKESDQPEIEKIIVKTVKIFTLNSTLSVNSEQNVINPHKFFNYKNIFERRLIDIEKASMAVPITHYQGEQEKTMINLEPASKLQNAAVCGGCPAIERCKAYNSVESVQEDKQSNDCSSCQHFDSMDDDYVCTLSGLVNPSRCSKYVESDLDNQIPF